MKGGRKDQFPCTVRGKVDDLNLFVAPAGDDYAYTLPKNRIGGIADGDGYGAPWALLRAAQWGVIHECWKDVAL